MNDDKGEGVAIAVVGVIIVGIALTHPELTSNVINVFGNAFSDLMHRVGF